MRRSARRQTNSRQYQCAARSEYDEDFESAADSPAPVETTKLQEIFFLLDKLIATADSKSKPVIQQVKAILSHALGGTYPYPAVYPYPRTETGKNKEQEQEEKTTEESAEKNAEQENPSEEKDEKTASASQEQEER